MRNLDDFIGKRFIYTHDDPADNIVYVLGIKEGDYGYYRLVGPLGIEYAHINGSKSWDFRDEDIWICIDDFFSWEVE